MSEVIVLQHEPFETLGTIEAALRLRRVGARYVRPFDGEPVPAGLADAVGLIVLGGTMGVYEQAEFPFLTDEIHLIESALRQDRPILGVCLGSQLLAAALGAEVYKAGRKEIGWFEVSLSPAAWTGSICSGIGERINVFHWHGDVFDLPRGADPLASSEMARCQAYRYGSKAYGLLFHMEVTREIIEGMVGAGENELEEEGLDGRSILEESRKSLPDLHKSAAAVWENWAGLIEL